MEEQRVALIRAHLCCTHTHTTPTTFRFALLGSLLFHICKQERRKRKQEEPSKGVDEKTLRSILKVVEYAGRAAMKGPSVRAAQELPPEDPEPAGRSAPSSGKKTESTSKNSGAAVAFLSKLKSEGKLR